MRELTEKYDRLMRELKDVVSQLTRLVAMKDSIEEAGGQLPPHVAAGLRKVDVRLRDGRSGALNVADPKLQPVANSKRTAAASKLTGVRVTTPRGVVAKTTS